MKSTIQRALLAVAVATLGAGAVGTAAAQSAPEAAVTPPVGQHHGRFHHHFGGAPFLGTFLHALHQLNSSPTPLSANQQNVLKTALQGARQAHSSKTAPDLTVIGNPGDSGSYTAAIGTAVSNAQARITEDATLASQIYTELTLTQAQQNELKTILADEQAKQVARRAQWAAKHAGNS